jgi:hypothetical protein
MDYGTLRVTTPDGQVREYPIDVPSAFVGRAEGNRVVIDHVTVSRRHARLTIDSGRLMVEDLGSATGTFVGSQRIPPHSPSLVEEGLTIRFGDVEALFLGPAPAPTAPELPLAGALPAAGVTPIQATGPTPLPAAPPPGPTPATPGGAQPISVSVKSPAAPVAAGSPTTATVVLQNRGTVVDEFSLSVPDLPAGWVRISRTNIPLLPGARDEVTVVIQPPHSAEALAGEYSFAVAVVSRELGIEVRALGRMTVLPFDGFQMALKPVRAKRDFKVVTHNTGNAPAAYALAGADDEGRLQYRFSPEQIELQPGEERPVDLRVRTKARRWFGKEEVKPFHVEARPAAAGVQRHTVDGQLRSRATLQAWRWLIVLLLLGGVLGGGAWGYTKACRDGWPLCGESKGVIPTEPGTTVPTATPQPGKTTAASPTPTARPATPSAGLRPGITAVVVNSPPGGTGNTNCLAVRDKPEINRSNPNEGVLRRICDGAEVSILAGPTNDGTYLFWRIRDAAGEGWAAEGPVTGGVKFLVPK